MRYLKSACGIPSSLGMVAGWQCSPMALAPWLRVAALLGIWWGRSTPASQGKVVQDKSSVLSDHSCFHLGGWASDWSPSLLLFLLLFCEWLHFHGISIFLGWVKISSEVEDGKKIQCSGIESCGWSTWDHLSWWPIPRKCFSPGVFLCTLDDHVPGVMLLRATGCACLPLISILSSPETC